MPEIKEQRRRIEEARLEGDMMKGMQGQKLDGDAKKNRFKKIHCKNKKYKIGFLILFVINRPNENCFSFFIFYYLIIFNYFFYYF